MFSTLQVKKNLLKSSSWFGKKRMGRLVTEMNGAFY